MARGIEARMGVLVEGEGARMGIAGVLWGVRGSSWDVVEGDKVVHNGTCVCL